MSPDVQICGKKTNCDNNGFLIADANLILYLIDSICGKIEEEHITSRRSDKFNSFCDVLDSILKSIRSCSLDGFLWTSDKVYWGEMSPINRISSLRREVHTFNTMCSRRNNNYQRVDGILRGHLQEITTSEDEILAIKSLYLHGPDNEDASLIVACIKKSMGSFKTILLTDDGELSKRMGRVTAKGNMTLGENNYPCTSIFPFTFLSFLELIHECCSLSSEGYAYSIHYKFLVEIERADTLPKAIGERKKKGIIRALNRFIVAMKEKVRQPSYAT